METWLWQHVSTRYQCHYDFSADASTVPVIRLILSTIKLDAVRSDYGDRTEDAVNQMIISLSLSLSLSLSGYAWVARIDINGKRARGSFGYSQSGVCGSLDI